MAPVPTVHDNIMSSPLKSTTYDHAKSVEDINVDSESDVSFTPEDKEGTYSSFGDFLSAYSMRVWGYTEPHNEYPWTNISKD
jgi:hypothetical protein